MLGQRRSTVTDVTVILYLLLNLWYLVSSIIA